MANPQVTAQSPSQVAERDRFEQRREIGRGMLLGTVCGFVLVVGSVLGFQQGEAPVSQQTAETLIAVSGH